jgi:D-glycero-beta-D-manno-heptose-7-phosphate kinase
MNKILLIGDSCIDIFIYGDCYRLNPEAPTAVLSETYRVKNDGMAANVFNNLKSLGLEADFITQEETIVKTRYIDEKSNYILLRIDNDQNTTPIQNLDKINFFQYDLVIVSDYNKGFLSDDILIHIFNRSKVSFIDTKKPIGDWITNVSFVKINEAEFKNPKNDMDFLSRRYGNKIIVTLGDKGVSYNGNIYPPPREIMVRDVVGAGDSFLASLAGHYLLHSNIEEAIKFANLCAGQVVSKKGVAYPDEKLIK